MCVMFHSSWVAAPVDYLLGHERRRVGREEERLLKKFRKAHAAHGVAGRLLERMSLLRTSSFSQTWRKSERPELANLELRIQQSNANNV